MLFVSPRFAVKTRTRDHVSSSRVRLLYRRERACKRRRRRIPNIIPIFLRRAARDFGSVSKRKFLRRRCGGGTGDFGRAGIEGRRRAKRERCTRVVLSCADTRRRRRSSTTRRPPVRYVIYTIRYHTTRHDARVSRDRLRRRRGTCVELEPRCRGHNNQ